MTTTTQRTLDSVRLVRVYPANRVEVWQQLVIEADRTRWWPDSVLEPRSGGSVLSTNPLLSGEVDTCLEGHALGFSWKTKGERFETSVLITLVSLTGSVQLSVLELGFLGLRESEVRIKESHDSWMQRLDGLGVVLANVPKTV